MLDLASTSPGGACAKHELLGSREAWVVMRELVARNSLRSAAASIDVPYRKALRAVSEAERRVGFKLVEPSGRGYRLTDFGRMLVETPGRAL